MVELIKAETQCRKIVVHISTKYNAVPGIRSFENRRQYMSTF